MSERRKPYPFDQIEPKWQQIWEEKQQKVLAEQQEREAQARAALGAHLATAELALEKRRQELEKKFVDLQQTYLKLEKDLQAERAKLIQDLLKQAGPKIEAIA